MTTADMVMVGRVQALAHSLTQQQQATVLTKSAAAMTRRVVSMAQNRQMVV
jgi:hypothetical protein